MRGARARACLTWLLLGLALGLGGCGTFAPDRPAKPRATAVRPPTSTGEACYEALTARGVAFVPMPQLAAAGACSIPDGVRVQHLKTTLGKPVSLSCPTAVIVDRWVEEIVQPAARRHLGQRVATVHHVGGFACRHRRDGNLSEHAAGRAIDIWGFDFDDGQRALIRDHWRGAGARSAFLQDVGRRSCTIFHGVIGPGGDRDHHDHLHLDLGAWRLCTP